MTSLETKPAVTVIVPTYNRCHILPKAIASIVSQTYENTEIVIVDDHSTDGTEEVVRGWMDNDRRIKYLMNTGPQGPSAARNMGLRNTTGRYVAYLESDDEWHNKHLERSMQFLVGHDVDIVFSDVVKLRDGKEAKDLDRRHLLEGCDLHAVNELVESYIVQDNEQLLRLFIDCKPVAYLTTVVYDREKLDLLFNECFCIAEDLLFYIENLLKGQVRFGFIDQVGTIKHEDLDSMSRWQHREPRRYYESQLSTYDFMLSKYKRDLKVSGRAILRSQMAKRSMKLADHLVTEGDRKAALASYLYSIRILPMGRFGAKLDATKKALRAVFTGYGWRRPGD